MNPSPIHLFSWKKSKKAKIKRKSRRETYTRIHKGKWQCRNEEKNFLLRRATHTRYVISLIKGWECNFHLQNHGWRISLNTGWYLFGKQMGKGKRKIFLNTWIHTWRSWDQKSYHSVKLPWIQILPPTFCKQNSRKTAKC